MKNEKLREFLRKKGSKDIDADEKMFNRITSDINAKRLERLAKNISNYSHITLNMGLFMGSYASPNKSGIIINIDPVMCYDPNDTFEQLWIKCMGATSHEAGHVAYSDFNIVGENKKREITAQLSIPKIGEKIADENFDSNTDEGKAVLNELGKAIYNYIYYKQLADMLNSIEDAGIEHTVPAYAPRTYGSIVAMRNFIYNEEVKFLREREHDFQNRDEDDFGYYITEMRHFAVIGYRKEITPIYLPKILSQEDIEEIELLGLYGRMGTTSTLERNAIAEVLLDKLKPLIDEKTNKFMTHYLMNLSMSGEELMSMMDMEMNGHTEMMCSGALDPSLAGKTKPQNITSDYQMSLPQKTMDKINEKMKERQEQQNNQGSGQGSQENQSSSQSDNNSSSNESMNNSQSSQQNGKSNEKNSESNSSEGKGEEKSERMEGEDGNKTSESNSESGEGQNSLTKNNDAETSSSANGKGKEFDKKSAALEAESAYKDSLKKAEKSFEKENATEFKQSVSSGKGQAPKLSNSLGDVNSITDCHKGIGTNYYPSNKIKNLSYSGRQAKNKEKELNKIALQFSKKLKEILMYQAKIRRKNGLKDGKLNDAALSRIITDQRVFRKTINGIEKKARLAVLIDLSGSMHGEKVQDAIAAAYMLADACSSIKVPISIMGHNTDYGNKINLYHFVEYENCFKKEAKEKIFSAEAGGANHDGLAIFHCATDLVRHRKPNEQLVLLVISDGAPAGHNNYWGELADKDIQKITGTFEKQFNVKTIGIGIGNDVDHVPNIYKNFLLVPNVSKLGDELLKVLKSLMV